MKDSDRLYETKIDILNKKIAGLIKEVAILTKSTKRGGGGAGFDRSGALLAATKDSGGSGTDSPTIAN